MQQEYDDDRKINKTVKQIKCISVCFCAPLTFICAVYPKAICSAVTELRQIATAVHSMAVTLCIQHNTMPKQWLDDVRQPSEGNFL